jgi:uncharacterized protein with NAD-binding domain and iron-sulfur cluster
VASFKDKDGNHIEMGLHVFFGCYNNLFRLMRKVRRFPMRPLNLKGAASFTNQGLDSPHQGSWQISVLLSCADGVKCTWFVGICLLANMRLQALQLLSIRMAQEYLERCRCSWTCVHLDY